MAERNGLHVYKLDATDVSAWDATVLTPALDVMARYFRTNDPPRGIPLMPAVTDEQRLTAWSKHYCERCNQTLNGDHEWKVRFSVLVGWLVYCVALNLCIHKKLFCFYLDLE